MFWSQPAGGLEVALPHIHLKQDYPRNPQNQLWQQDETCPSAGYGQFRPVERHQVNKYDVTTVFSIHSTVYTMSIWLEIKFTSTIFNRPGVAGAVLQTASPLIN